MYTEVGVLAIPQCKEENLHVAFKTKLLVTFSIKTSPEVRNIDSSRSEMLSVSL